MKKEQSVSNTVSSDEVISALVALGEDPTARRVAEISQKLNEIPMDVTKVAETRIVDLVDSAREADAQAKAAARKPTATKLIRERGRISLVLDDPTVAEEDRAVVAAMTLYEGTGCWRLMDVRLSRHRVPSPYFGGLNADDLCASIKPESPAEAAYVKSRLREYQEEADGTILWCSFDGIVRGEATVNGHSPATYAGFDQAGYFGLRSGLKKLVEIKAFWETHHCAPKEARIANPFRQPGESQLFGELIARRLKENADATPSADVI